MKRGEERRTEVQEQMAQRTAAANGNFPEAQGHSRRSGHSGHTSMGHRCNLGQNCRGIVGEPVKE